MTGLFQRILVPYDFSEPASQALALAADLAPPGARLSVLHVVAPLPAGPDVPAWVPTAADVSRAREHLEAVTRKILMRRPVALDCHVVIGNPFREIMRAARDASAIVMATTGRTGLAHLVIGSVAEKVVRHSPVPVLTFRARRAIAGQQTP